jgi:hypothetical protein
LGLHEANRAGGEGVSTLSRAVKWTQRVGYSYPPRYFPSAVKDRFPLLSRTQIEHCVSVYEDAHGAWMKRVEARLPFIATPQPQEKM